MSDYTTNELSDAATFALAYAQALVYGQGSEQAKRFREGLAKLNLTDRDKRAALAKGLAELREMGIVDCERDGEGDLVPTKLHEERVRAAAARLVTGDLQ